MSNALRLSNTQETEVSIAFSIEWFQFQNRIVNVILNIMKHHMLVRLEDTHLKYIENCLSSHRPLLILIFIQISRWNILLDHLSNIKVHWTIRPLFINTAKALHCGIEYVTEHSHNFERKLMFRMCSAPYHNVFMYLNVNYI